MLCFPIGMLIADNRDRAENLFKKPILIIGGYCGITFMAVTQLSVVKALPYIVSNIMSLFTVLPLAIAVIVFVNAVKVLIDNRTLIGAGKISYEIYLVHAFTLGIVSTSIVGICFFIVVTALCSIVLHWLLSKK